MGIIIGITGTLGAGKGTIVDYLLQTEGFEHFSARQFIVEEIEKRNLSVNRDSMVAVGNDLRAKHSPSYIAEQLYEKAKLTGKNCVIESLRTVGEINALKKKGNFYLFSVDADPKIRYERITKRQSESDKVSYEKFLDDEKRELTSNDPNKQNLSECIKLADYKFENNKTIDELNKNISLIMEKIKLKDVNNNNDGYDKDYKRPSWDDYFLEVANTVAKRATCNRGRSGCVIARDKQILVTGYVGSPQGLSHCDDVGHQYKKVIHEDGHVSTHCVRTVHAEQNAICQAAKRGISLNNSTLYCRMTPCRTCAMLIINCGITKVVCEKKYHAGIESEEMFQKAGIKITFKHNELQKYDNQ